MAKNYVVIKGRVVRMEDSTYEKFAVKHFGATKNRPPAKDTPIELLKFPKVEPAKVEAPKIEAPRVLRRKPVNRPVELNPELPKVEPPKVEVPKVEPLKVEPPVEVKVEQKPAKKKTKK